MATKEYTEIMTAHDTALDEFKLAKLEYENNHIGRDEFLVACKEMEAANDTFDRALGINAYAQGENAQPINQSELGYTLSEKAMVKVAERDKLEKIKNAE